MQIDFDGRMFQAVSNSDSGEVGDGTIFHYHQDGDLVWANYNGGSIRRGHLIATIAPDGTLDMRYHHVNSAGALMAGVCKSRIEVLENGRYRLHES
jgi:hypothetical protein